MGATTKGLPYPEGTDPVHNGAAAIQALAESLDFTRITQLTTAQIPTPATPMESYPLGASALSVGSSDAPNWPGQQNGHLWTFKTNTGRLAQFYFSTAAGPSATNARAYYRQMPASPGAPTPWVLLSPWSTVITFPDIAAGANQTMAVTFPANLFGANPMVAVTGAGSSNLLCQSLTSTPTPSGFTVSGRNLGATTLSGMKAHVIAEGSY